MNIVPNVLTGSRVLGLAPLLWAAHAGRRTLFLGLLAFLLLTDLIDGPLARRLRQEGRTGARLDSVADWLLYGALAVSCWWLEEAAFRENLTWFVTVFGTWLVSALVCLARFGALPSYHTRLAKGAALVTGPVALAWILFGWTGGVPWALALVTIANLEGVAISMVVSERLTDVPDLRYALARERDRGGGIR